MELSEDCIVVARPDGMIDQDAKCASESSKHGKAGSASQAGANFEDALGSEDELSLPFQAGQTKTLSKATVTSVFGKEGSEDTPGSSGHEYKSLLSQFKLDKKAQKDGQVKAAPDAAPEARPKRQPKPKKFPDTLI